MDAIRNRKSFLKKIGIVLICSFGFILNNTISRAYSTQIMVFSPALPENSQSKSGYCFSESIAYTRPGAWRCMVDSSIYDPCFSMEDGTVVCDVNPATYQSGFELKLTKPLPTSNLDPSKPIFSPQYNGGWMIKLTDGSVCKANTGSLPVVNQMAVRYSCSDSGGCLDNGTCPYLTGLFDSIRSGNVWIAVKVFYSIFPNTSPRVLKTQSVAIATVWQ